MFIDTPIDSTSCLAALIEASPSEVTLLILNPYASYDSMCSISVEPALDLESMCVVMMRPMRTEMLMKNI